MRWVDAWNELYEIIGTRFDADCLLPDGSVVSVEECQGWLQEPIYAGYELKVKEGQVLGKSGVVVSRWKD